MKTTKIFNLAITILACLLPFFFLPLTADFYFFNKLTLLYFGVALLLAGWAFKAYQKKKISFQKALFGWPILGFLLVFIFSLIIQSPNKLASLANPVGIIFSLSLLYLVIVNNASKDLIKKVLVGLIVVSVILAWLTVFAFLGIGENLKFSWIQTKAWTPTGSPLNTLGLMLALLPLTLFWGFKAQSSSTKILLFLAGGLQILASILILTLFTQGTVQFLYLLPQYGWQICVEGLKSFRTALLGVGPANFVNAFTQFRPFGLNNTDLWAVRFGSNSNEYFHLLSTVGVLGLGLYLWLVWQVTRKENRQGSLTQRLVYLLLLSCFVIQLLIPSNILIWFFVFLGLSLMELIKRPAETSPARTSLKPIVFGFSGLAVLLAVLILYFQGRLWLADYHFNQSILAIQENKGIETYNSQIKAINLNPFREGYRISYANTNFALANSLAGQPDLSDQDRANITQLISQSVNEAKNAINLNPQSSNHWLNLAETYRNLVNFAEGADQWTIAAYQQAIQLDPTNPIIRVNLGGFFYALGNFEEATRQFQTAINLKPDYANGYYNLAVTLKEQGKFLEAFNAMQVVVSLVPGDSADYQTALTELEDLRSKLPTAETQVETTDQPAELTPPQPLPAPAVQPPIELPEETGPENVEESAEEAESTPLPTPTL